MREVKVYKSHLRSTLIQNKEDHEADFQITWKKYKSALMERLHEMVEQARELEPGTQVSYNLYDLPYPENHADDYQRAIEMLDWEIGDEVTLTQSEFSQFVQDNWSWKGQFSSTNMMYAGSASPSKFKQ